MNAHTRNLPSVPRIVGDILEEYDRKLAAVDSEIKAFESALNRMNSAAVIQGTFVERVINGNPYVHASAVRKNLRASGWKTLYSRLNIDLIASATDKALFKNTLADPPELTRDNVVATFADYLLNARFHILRGLAEVFSGLDRAYKSHANVKIGVKGLPKRVIISGVGDVCSGGRDRLLDVLNALALVQGLPLVEHAELAELDALRDIWGHKAGEVSFAARVLKVYRSGDYEEQFFPNRGVTVKKFGNGNAHIIFDQTTFIDINRALAEFYGDVLPDADDENAPKQASTAIAKDLQFYWTPKAAREKVLSAVDIHTAEEVSGERARYKVLEPSCGNGLFMDEIRSRRSDVFGIEYHAGRAAEARAKGHAVLTANFLETPPQPIYDRVVMNPPFYGKHWLKHLRHALKFLKPEGKLVTILPATASGELIREFGGTWYDLPTASFAEAGTNISTGYLVIDLRFRR